MIEEATQPQLQRRAPGFDVRLARCDDDILGAQRLRYAVFVEEMGAGGDMVDHLNRFERDELDPFFDHLLLIDRTRDPATHEHVIGVYRLLPCDRARALGRFYCDSEYDLAPLRQSGRKLVELGRSCVHRDHRRGAAMLHLWNGLADYVLSRGIQIMFGVASFPGIDVTQHAMALSYLSVAHRAPPALRVRALPQHFQPMDLIPPEAIDRQAALAAIPPLIRAYLRLGGFVGEGAFVDRAFNTTDVCLIMDTSAMSEKHLDFYARKAPRA
ncbi:GNAT family N-acyltransferase [Pararhodobacter sp. SW119]|uniref:GNAT family N-acetyltransferase n=1 Tax=Pararhodobacter sp. SW119 TaxID=2780075 RepID=UPI001ADF3C7A|nr:GNAT family N-acyltransferase [Pararhodobacter sp. SW119]